MNTELEQLAAQVDAELGRLGPLLDVDQPAWRFTTRLRQVVEAEGQRMRWRRRVAPLCTALAAAAAVLLAIGLNAPRTQPLDVFEGLGPEQVLDAWTDASAEAGESFTMLYEDDWLDASTDIEGERGLDDAADSLDRAFEAFDRVFGT